MKRKRVRPSKAVSKKAYIGKRQAAVRVLFVGDGLAPRDIAAQLVADGTIVTTDESLESAVRLVRSDIAKIRKAIDSGREKDAKKRAGSNRQDALERELARLREELQRQKAIAAGEPDSDGIEATVTTTIDTPNGLVTSVRPKWPPGVRQKASKDAASLVEKISKIEVQLGIPEDAAQKAAEEEHGGFQFVFPQVKGAPNDLNDLVAMNLERAKVN